MVLYVMVWCVIVRYVPGVVISAYDVLSRPEKGQHHNSFEEPGQRL